MRPLIGIPVQGNAPSQVPRFCANQSYCHAVYLAGGNPLLLPLLDDEEALLEVHERIDGLLLAGGGDLEPHHFGETRIGTLTSVDPARDRVELFLTRQAVKDRMPVLAICRGIQVLNVALVGTLYQDIPSQIPQAICHDLRNGHARNYLGHTVHVEAGTRTASILGTGPIAVNSLHHQAIKEVAASLRVAATAPDGVIEAAEGLGECFVVGVQWHPEELIDNDPRMKRLFEVLVEEAGTRHHR